MKKYKATKKFQGLGIENSYQQLTCEDYYRLKEGKSIEGCELKYLNDDPILLEKKTVITGEAIKNAKMDFSQ